jgi:hypothetical protein
MSLLWFYLTESCTYGYALSETMWSGHLREVKPTPRWILNLRNANLLSHHNPRIGRSRREWKQRQVWDAAGQGHGWGWIIRACRQEEISGAELREALQAQFAFPTYPDARQYIYEIIRVYLYSNMRLSVYSFFSWVDPTGSLKIFSYFFHNRFQIHGDIREQKMNQWCLRWCSCHIWYQSAYF